MRAFLIGLLCLFLWTSVARYIYVCKIKDQCQTAPVATIPLSNRLTNLRLIDGNTTILEGYEQFAFAKNSIAPDLSNDNRNYLDGVAAFLKNNPDKNLEITGFFRPSEADVQNGIYENLGLARANVVKDLLIERGIAKERLYLDYNGAEEDLESPLAFSLVSDIPESAEVTDEKLTKTQYSFENMVFSDANFESNSAVFKPNQAFINWSEQVKAFFDTNSTKTLTIIGHTDKTGPDNYNKELGIERAKSAKQYFEKMGVKVDIKISSMGEKEPIATNKTKIGRQKNRRVNFIIK